MPRANFTLQVEDNFENFGKDIVIYGQEVNDPMAQCVLVPCGTVIVNRTFLVNPGQRLIFKLCIWKNDVIAVPDTTRIAQIFRVPISDNYYSNNENNSCNCGCNNNSSTNDDYNKMTERIAQLEEKDKTKDYLISELITSINNLNNYIKQIHPVEDTIPTVPPTVSDGTDDGEITPPTGEDSNTSNDDETTIPEESTENTN